MTSECNLKLAQDAVTYAGVCALVFGALAACAVGVDSAPDGDPTQVVGAGVMYAVVGLIVGTLIACARGGRSHAPPWPEATRELDRWR